MRREAGPPGADAAPGEPGRPRDELDGLSAVGRRSWWRWRRADDADGSERRGRRPVANVVAAAVSALVLGGVVWSAWTYLRWPDVAALGSRNPETTAFIERYRADRRAAGDDDRVQWRWTPIADISPHLRRAVVAGEDMEFFFHDGFSTAEMRAALRDALARRRAPRGASTITQQLAKNLWLSPSRNPLRKVKEALLTRALERELSKQRILELYLNVAEFGRGIYGAGAASWHYFGIPASALSEHHAAMLAAALPRPSTWHPGSDSRSYAGYVRDIERRMERAPFLWRYVGGEPPPEVPATLDSSVVMDLRELLRGAGDTPDSSVVPLLPETIPAVPAETVGSVGVSPPSTDRRRSAPGRGRRRCGPRLRRRS